MAVCKSYLYITRFSHARIPGSHFLEERFGRELLRLRSLRAGRCDDVEVGLVGWRGWGRDGEAIGGWCVC